MAQKDYNPVLPPIPDNLADDEEAMRIVCLVKNKQQLVSRGLDTTERFYCKVTEMLYFMHTACKASTPEDLTEAVRKSR